MKQIVLFLFLLSIQLQAQPVAFEYSVEMDQEQLSQDVIEAIIDKDSPQGTCGAYEGIPYDLDGDGNETDYLVTGFEGCSGASSAPFYIVQKQNNGEYRVILSTSTISVDILEERVAGLPRLKLSEGSAGVYLCEFWEFNGVEYERTQSLMFNNGDEEMCRKYPDICPWKMD